MPEPAHIAGEDGWSVVDDWHRNPDFSSITLRYPALFHTKRAWVRRWMQTGPTGWHTGYDLEYATDEQLAAIVLKEKFGVDEH